MEVFLRLPSAEGVEEGEEDLDYSVVVGDGGREFFAEGMAVAEKHRSRSLYLGSAHEKQREVLWSWYFEARVRRKEVPPSKRILRSTCQQLLEWSTLAFQIYL